MATDEESEVFASAVAAQVRAEIAAKDETVASIARKTGINRETLNRWVKGERVFNMSNLVKVADALELAPSALIRRAEERRDQMLEELRVSILERPENFALAASEDDYDQEAEGWMESK